MAKVFPLPWFMKCQALVADCSVVNWALSPSCSAWAGFYGKSTHTSQQSWSVGILHKVLLWLTWSCVIGPVFPFISFLQEDCIPVCGLLLGDGGGVRQAVQTFSSYPFLMHFFDIIL